MVATKNSARHQWFFGTKIVLLFLFVVCVSVQVKAQTFQSTSPYSMTQQGRQAVDVNSAGSYHTYESTIYEPFSEAAPSSSNDRVPAGMSGRRNSDINILSPCVNRSGYKYIIETDGIRCPLSIIRNVGKAGYTEIAKARGNGEFLSFTDFVTINSKSSVKSLFSISVIKAS